MQKNQNPADNMKAFSVKGRNRAFTLLEMFVVISVVAVLALWCLLRLGRVSSKATGINCTNNLKQVGLAFRIWSDDYGTYPMKYRAHDFDGPNYAIQQKMYVYFQTMSNELSTPKIVLCPGDPKRTSGTNFTTDFDNSKVSYFVGLDAAETNATMFLAGDCNISNGASTRNGILELTANQPMTWTKNIHEGQGNILLANGSVQRITSQSLSMALQRTGVATNRLALP
jgi:prepilin-type N-terminal cleavage/methylation domain-containing protein